SRWTRDGYERCSLRGSRGGRQRAAGAALRPAGDDLRVDQRDDGSFIESGDDRPAFGAVGYLHVVSLEAIARVQVDEGLATLLEDRLTRSLEGVRNLAAVDHEPHGRSGAQPRIRLIEGEVDVELTDR